MGCRPGSLQEIFNPGSNFTWAGFAYATNDTLEEALKPGYFDGWAEGLQPGDLILFGCNPARLHPQSWHRPTQVRRALLMVTRVERMRVSVRVLHDWGGVEDEPGEPPQAAGQRRP
ncbi:hypothetical protein [Benzoatithermus flavus]|uniref:Uncharacterized protein n=1 Tax=Benzoatithermus flavus TaxID=3108223 RepID=A0ABU8XPN5_9PROT